MGQKAHSRSPKTTGSQGGFQGVEVHVEKAAPCSAQVRLHVPSATLIQARSQITSNLGKRFRVKGFRPGKAPREMIEKQFGKDIDQEVMQHFLEHGLQKAVEDGELAPAAAPRVQVADFPGAGEDLNTEFEIPLRPEIELGQIEGLQVEGRSVGVSDEEVESALEDLKRQNSRVEAAGDEGLEAEGMMLCQISYVVDGESEPCLEREGMRLSPKTTPWGVLQEDFEKKILGAKVGDEREFSVEIPDEFPVEEARGKKGSLKVRFDEVYKVTPPTNEELHSAVEVTTDSGMTEAIRARILDYKQGAENHRVENTLIERILGDHPFDLPEVLVGDQVEGRLAELRENLEKEELDAETIEERLNAEKGGAEESSRRGLKAIYLFEEIAKKQSLLLKAQDFEVEFAAIARRNNTTPQEVQSYYKDQKGLVNQLGIELLERKVRSFLRESADIQVVPPE